MSVFLHENTPDFFRAAIKGEAYKFVYPTLGIRMEKYNVPKNQPLDDVFNQSGCVGLLSMGHNHPLAVQCSYYEGTYYHVTPQAKKQARLLPFIQGQTIQEICMISKVFMSDKTIPAPAGQISRTYNLLLSSYKVKIA